MVFEFTANSATPGRPLDDSGHSGFTPVIRQSKAQSNDSPASSIHVPWTATRCHRLLRPIASRLLLLRRGGKPTNPERRLGAVSDSDTSHRRKGPGSRKYDAESFSAARSFGEDPDWDPEVKPRKKLKRTYSARNHGSKSQPEQGTMRLDRDILLPNFVGGRTDNAMLGVEDKGSSTTVLNEDALLEKDRCALENAEIEEDRAPIARTREELCRLAKSKTDCWMLYEGLFKGLEALLQATEKIHSGSRRTEHYDRKGVRGLFATCLRNVPAYIAQEQAWTDEEDPASKEDVSGVIYADLESLSSSERGGWKHLRSVVRAHGVHMINGAIRDGTIPRSLAWKFVALCRYKSAYDESKTLCASLLDVAPPLAPPTWRALQVPPREEGDTVVDLIGYWMKGPGSKSCTRFMALSLARLLESGSLPVEYVFAKRTEYPQFWAGMALRSSCDTTAAVAAKFIRAAVSMSYRSQEKGGKPTVSSRQHSSARLTGTLRERSTDEHKCEEALEHSANEVDPKIVETTTREIINLVGFVTSGACCGRLVYGELSPSRRASFSALLEAMALDALQRHEDEEHRSGDAAPLGSVAVARRALPSLGFHLATSVPPDSPLLQLLLPARSDRTAIGILAAFVNRLAFSVGRDAAGQFAALCEVVDRILALARDHPEAPAAGDIAVAAAMEFVEREGVSWGVDRKTRQAHLDWALEVEESVHNGDCGEPAGDGDSAALLSRPDARSKPPPSAFRWEEPIGEWVTKTPLPCKTTNTAAPGPRVCVAVCVPALRACAATAEPAVEAALEAKQPLMDDLSPAPKRRRGRPSKSWPNARVAVPETTTSRSGSVASSRTVPKGNIGNQYRLDASDQLTEGGASLPCRKSSAYQPTGRPRGRPRKTARPTKQAAALPASDQFSNRADRVVLAPTRKVEILMDGSSDDELCF